MRFCICGCGTEIKQEDCKSAPGHNPRRSFPRSQEIKDKISRAKKGMKRPDLERDRNHNWRGGFTVSRGRVLYRINQKLVPLSRLIMQDLLGRFLTDSEDVHHINGIKNDDRPANLQLIDKAEHARMHTLARPRDPITGRMLRCSRGQ